jgi:large subunit ribosomal protein L3
MKAILGRKLRMSQVFLDNGDAVPVTVVKAGPCRVVQRKTLATDGYEAVQLGLDPYNRANKPEAGHFKKLIATETPQGDEKPTLKPMKVLREIRVSADEPLNVGGEVKADVFKAGEKVIVTGYTKGRGFAGGMKRWGWSGGPASHGSMSHRRIGSVGSNTYPGRPWRGRSLPGRYGNERVTLRNLEVVKVDAAAHLVYLKGAIPGPNQGLVVIQGQ